MRLTNATLQAGVSRQLNTAKLVQHLRTRLCAPHQVDQRVSVTERVTRSVESRVVGLADEVSALEERVSKVSAGHQTQRVMLEEMQADDQRSRCVPRLIRHPAFARMP